MAIRINITKEEVNNNRLPFKTGQTISYATGDDGDTQRGDNRYWLTGANHFGNLARRTGITGGYFDVDTLQYKNADGSVIGIDGASRLLAFPDKIILDWRLVENGYVQAFDLGDVSDVASVWGGYRNGGTRNWASMLTFGATIQKLSLEWSMINLSELNEEFFSVITEVPIITVMGQSTGESIYTGCSTTVMANTNNVYGFDLGSLRHEQMDKLSSSGSYRFIYTTMVDISIL